MSGTAEAAGEVFAALSSVGVDLDDVFKVIEDEGVAKFEKAWNELLETLSEQLTRRSPEQQS